MIYLIDASVYIFRAYFSLPESLRSPAGAPVNAVYGFTQFLLDILEREKPRFIACAFDESLVSSFRNRIYPAYKANRELPPPGLEQQLKYCRRVARALGIRDIGSRRYEADDIIGTLATRYRTKQRPVVIVTRDKDLAQLIRPGDCFWDYASGVRHDSQSLLSKLGVLPEQVPDLLGLAGDAVDNIPGIAGIGMKTAAALLRQFDDLDAIYANLSRVEHLPIRGARALAARLGAGREVAFLSRRLATVHCDIPLRITLRDLRHQSPKPRAVKNLFDELGFGGTLRERTGRLVA